MTFSQKIKKLRDEEGWTQEVAKDELGISISALRNYENGRLPETDILKRFKDTYKVPYEYLLDDNCKNKSLENININSMLHLTDESILAIKSCEPYKDALNMLINEIGIKYFCETLAQFLKTHEMYREYYLQLYLLQDIAENIIESIKAHNEIYFKEYFDKCDIAITKLNEFFYGNFNPSFNPSDSSMDCLKDTYFRLKSCLFEESDIDINDKILSFSNYFKEFFDVLSDIHYNLQKSLKICDYELTERFYIFKKDIIQPFLFTGDKQYTKLLGNYIKNVNEDSKQILKEHNKMSKEQLEDLKFIKKAMIRGDAHKWQYEN